MNIGDIVTREEFEKITKLTYEQFCDFATRIIKKSVEESIRALPPVMVHLTSQTAYLKKLSDKFYDDNKDLNPHRPLVARVIEGVEADNPGMPYDRILKLAGPKARKLVLSLRDKG